MNTQLKRAVFGAETIGWNACLDGRNSNQKSIRIHPPGEPDFELWLAAELVHQVTVVIEDGAVTNDVGSTAGGIEFGGNLRMQNPELALKGCSGIDGEWRLASDLGDQLDIAVRFFQERADFVGQGCLADSVGTNECELQISALARVALSF